MNYPLPTLAAVLSDQGITAPAYSDILTSLQTSFGLIYGTDVYLDPSSQDGQLLAIFAQAIFDANQTAIAVYNQFSPLTAQGAGLSSLVKINGLQRLYATNSQVDLLIGGAIGTTINNGAASDANGNLWKLPGEVIIPLGGSIVVTATCSEVGAVDAAPSTVTTIATPTLGWSTVTNPSAATPGNPVETDAALRQRQANAVSLHALTVLSATVAAISAIPGVLEVMPYENATNATDANGLPAHSISMVVRGGDATAIAQAIANKKTPGCATYGSTTVNIVDAVGISHAINFYVPAAVRVVVALTIHALAGYVAATGNAIKQALIDYVNALPIGADVMITRLYLPAQLNGDPRLAQYELTALTAAIYPASPGTTDLVIAFNAMAALALADITLTVT